MIPKKIHYCWFGGKPLPQNVKNCIKSWERYAPDYKIQAWNELNFNVHETLFSSQAYKDKKWAFVSDFARTKILYEHGGFYLDTDMELRNSLDDFLNHEAVCGFEMKGVPFSAFFGVERGHTLAKDMKEYYENLDAFDEIPNTKIFSELLVKKYGADPNSDTYQKLDFGINLYPSHYFSLDLPKNYITHHFSGSWHNAWTEDSNEFKAMVNTYGILNMLSNMPQGKKNIHNVIFNHKLIREELLLDQFPYKILVKYVVKNFLAHALRFHRHLKIS